MTNTVTVWHVTDPQSAQEISRSGFLGNWGDAGFGVYFFDDLRVAEEYAQQGGWQHNLTEFRILEAEIPNDLIEVVLPDPGWPNPEDYEHVFWVPMDDGNDDEMLRVPTKILA